jgi:hypothetical protein
MAFGQSVNNFLERIKQMRLKFIIPLLTFLALGGCAVNSDRVPANFVSAKQYVDTTSIAANMNVHKPRLRHRSLSFSRPRRR